MIIDGAGKHKEVEIKIGLQDFEMVGSCPVHYRGKMYIYGGGGEHEYTISVVEQCTVKYIRNLDFRMHWFPCGQRNNSEIYLCFTSPSKSKNVCRRSTEPAGSFEEKLPNANYEHRKANIAFMSGEYTSASKTSLNLPANREKFVIFPFDFSRNL